MLNKQSKVSEHLRMRAHRSTVHPKCLGIRLEHGFQILTFKVPSQSKPSQSHLVEVSLDLTFPDLKFVDDFGLSFQFQCSCEAAAFGTVCIHALVVRRAVNQNWLHWFITFAPDLHVLADPEPSGHLSGVKTAHPSDFFLKLKGRQAS